jgi:hypothetical protein
MCVRVCVCVRVCARACTPKAAATGTQSLVPQLNTDWCQVGRSPPGRTELKRQQIPGTCRSHTDSSHAARSTWHT